MPDSRKKSIYPSARALFAVLFTLVLLADVFSVAAHAEKTEPVTVKVGYYENEVFEEGAEEGAIKTGYAYEYYRKISEYTGWKYEYVYGDFNSLYDKLLNGEIDMLAGLAKKDERLNSIGYPDSPMGHETYNLVKHISASDITLNPATLNGKTIGVLDSAMVDVLNRYLEENSVNATVKKYKEYTGLWEAFDAEELDLIAAEGDGAYGRDDAEVLAPFGSSDYYLCIAKNRADLLADLNEAQLTLEAEEPHWLQTLDDKYYPVSISVRAFSASEKEWLDSHDTMKVGYLDDYLPYSATDKNGKVTGIVKDIIPEILTDLGLFDLKVTYTGYKSYDDMIDDMTSGEIDVAFPVGGGLYFSEENGIYQSVPVTSSSVELVFKDDYSEKTPSHFAINENNRMQYYFIRTNFPKAEITLYPSIEACLDAVVSGEANCTTLNGLRANDILKNSKYKDLVLHQLTRNDDRCFGVEIGNEGLLKLLNRGMNVVGSDYAQNISFRYTGELYTYTLWDAIKDNMVLFVAIIFAIGVIIILLLIRDKRRTKKQMMEKESVSKSLEEKNKELEISQRELSETDEIISGAGFGTWHIILERDKKPRLRGNAKMMELLGIADATLSEEEIYEAWHSGIVPEDLPSVENSVAEMLKGNLNENT